MPTPLAGLLAGWGLPRRLARGGQCMKWARLLPGHPVVGDDGQKGAPDFSPKGNGVGAPALRGFCPLSVECAALEPAMARDSKGFVRLRLTRLLAVGLQPKRGQLQFHLGNSWHKPQPGGGGGLFPGKGFWASVPWRMSGQAFQMPPQVPTYNPRPIGI